ncbi:MAG: hypothetical protein B7Z08_05310 [Sphingomonadales bacterium 32-68-7]|nr:MAG: hypothetical protein B7Z33_00885 [Sphingomonadales bacterium 12-68-11]OYX09419.1 MAG: hypothetical protein B7Z08_05310 [Sphingomonadales bacterium 32-68-7]
MEAYLSGDGARAVLVLLLAIGQALMAYWPELRKWPETIPTRSAKLRNPLVPIDWAFAIWGPIFAGIAAFAVWQVLPANLDDPLAGRIGGLAIAVFAGNILWEAWVPRRGLDWVSVAIIWTELALLLAVWMIIAGSDQQGWRFWLISAPFQLFAGWVSAAVFVNTASTLQRSGIVIGQTLSAAMLLLAAALGATVAVLTGGWLYAAALAWALFGIVIANTARENHRPVAMLAGVLAAAVLAAPALA